MAIVLFDNHLRRRLFPLTYTKAIACLRFGILSIQERWELLTKQATYIHTADYLQPLYPTITTTDNIWVDASVMADEKLIAAILGLSLNECLVDENGLIAGRSTITFDQFNKDAISFPIQISYASVQRLNYPWQIMQWNDSMIRADFKLVTKGRSSQAISPTVNFIQTADIFIEEGAKLEFCTLNSATGPIYIGKDAEVMEGTCIRGPFVLGTNSVLKMNSRIYGATSLGPSCMGGGEIKNSVIMGYTNKAHDGYLGDAVVGEWCNFGAGSTNSNVKNTAGEVKVWDYASNSYLGVGQKCGVIMGDFSRIAINSSINTGSVIGVSANVFGSGLLPTIIDNFSWGVAGGIYDIKKAFFAINNWKQMKQHTLSNIEINVLQTIFDKMR